MATEGTNLRSMTRDELNDYAVECGIVDPASYANKDDLVAAIEGLAAPQGETLGEGFAVPQGETLDEPAATPAPKADEAG